MPKNPFTGEEMRKDVYEFITEHNSRYQSKVNELNNLYLNSLSSKRKTDFDRFEYAPTDDQLQSETKSLADLEEEVAQKKKAVEYYKAMHNEEDAKKYLDAAQYPDYDKNSKEYLDLLKECWELKDYRLSTARVEEVIENFFHDPAVIEDVKDKEKTLGGDKGIIHEYGQFALMKTYHKDIKPNYYSSQVIEAVDKIIGYACKARFQSPNLEEAGDKYFAKEQALEGYLFSQNEFNKVKAKYPGQELIDEKTFKEYDSVITQYERIVRTRDEVKKEFEFPKKDKLDVESQNQAISKYTEARERADSHWGITKFFASFLPGLFPETAKDMADEKFWKKTLIKANFTKEDLHIENEKDDVSENLANDEAEKNGTEIEDSDVSSRLSKDVNKNSVKAKASDKQSINPNIEKNKNRNKNDLQA